MTLRSAAWLPEAVLLLALLFGPLAFGATEPWSLAILEGLLFASAALAASRGEAPNRAAAALLGAVLAVLSVGAVQALNSRPLTAPGAGAPFASSKGLARQAVLLWASYASAVFAASILFSRRSAFGRLLWTVFMLGVVVAVVGLVQQGQGNEYFYGLRPIRLGLPFGPYTDRDHAASLLSFSWFIGWGILFSRFAGFRNQGEGVVFDFAASQTLILFLIGVVGWAIMKTTSRGAMLSMAVASMIMGFTMLFSPRTRRAAAAGLLVLAAAISTAIWSTYPWCFGIVAGQPDMSLRYRRWIYADCVKLIKDFPGFGIGLGCFRESYPAYHNPLLQGFVDHAHEDWLELAAQVGVVGLILYLVGLGLCLALIVKAWRRQAGPQFWLGAGTLGALLGFLVHGLVEFSFQIPANAVVFLAVFASLGGQYPPCA